MSYAGRVLALDLGAKTGWVVRQGDAVVDSGTVEFRGGRAGDERRHERLAGLFRWLTQTLLDARLDGTPFDVVAYERPFARGLDATRSLWGMAGLVEAVATVGGASVLDVNVSTLKRHAGVKAKDKPMRWAKDQGYLPATDHEADALLLADYVVANAEEE